jgi:predicted nucleic-acid-binding protein
MKRIAIDTNILARLLADVESDEGRYAEELLETSSIYVAKTVLVETEWILRKIMKIERVTINEMMAAMLLLPNVEMEDAEDVRTALAAHASGMDFADAIHVLGSSSADRFVTFDRDLVKLANKHISHLTVELAQ